MNILRNLVNNTADKTLLALSHRITETASRLFAGSSRPHTTRTRQHKNLAGLLRGVHCWSWLACDPWRACNKCTDTCDLFYSWQSLSATNIPHFPQMSRTIQNPTKNTTQIAEIHKIKNVPHDIKNNDFFTFPLYGDTSTKNHQNPAILGR